MINIAHNLVAMNSQRQFGITTNNKAKSTEKLSSGYRINRSADDAAGLAISEKMRRQIRGLNQGVENIEDGISFLQVADGAMHEINDMLGRLTELSIQAANGTLDDSDRKAIDEEVQAIKVEIDRINDTTTFNSRKVFFEKGSIIKTITPTANSAFFQLMAGDASTTGYMQEELASDYLKTLNYTSANDINGGNPYTGVHIDFGNLFSNGNFEQLNGTKFYVNCCTDCCPTVVQFDDSTDITISQDTPSPYIDTVITIGLKKDADTYYANAADFTSNIVDKLKNINGHVEFANDGNRLWIYDIDPNDWSETSKKLAYFCDTTNIYNPGTMIEDGIQIQMSGTVDDVMSISTGIVNTSALGIDTIKVDPLEAALESIDKIKSALLVSSQIRSNIGSQQNRLEHAVNINRYTAENTTAAESRIRDTDMAKEMIHYSNLNILEQVGHAMIAQSNQSNQSVLNLLQ